jgi:type II secretory pathway pseudopilin PulG
MRIRKRGFTLAEIVVYASIVALLFFVVSNTLIVLMRVHNDSRAIRALQESGLTTIERLGREIRDANSVSGSSVLNTNPGTLIISQDVNGTASSVQFSVSNGALRMSRGGVDQGPISGSNVTVSNFIVRKSDNGPSDLVKVELTLQSRGKTESFYTSALLRGSYSN